MTGLVGGPLLVGGLGPRPPAPLKSGPAVYILFNYKEVREDSLLICK